MEGLSGAADRACAYVRAGADAIFPEALESAEEFRAFGWQLRKEGIEVPLIANMTEFGKTPYLSVKEFEELGYRIILFPVTSLRVAMKAIEEMLHEVRTSGTQRDLLGRMQTRQQLYDLLEYDQYTKQDQILFDQYGRPPEV